MLSNEKQLAILKSRAVVYYTRVMDIADQYDCGTHLMETISPEFIRSRTKLNIVWRQIKELDENAPALPEWLVDRTTENI